MLEFHIKVGNCFKLMTNPICENILTHVFSHLWSGVVCRTARSVHHVSALEAHGMCWRRLELHVGTVWTKSQHGGGLCEQTAVEC